MEVLMETPAVVVITSILSLAVLLAVLVGVLYFFIYSVRAGFNDVPVKQQEVKLDEAATTPLRERMVWTRHLESAPIVQQELSEYFKPRRTSLPPGLRFAAFKKDGYRCQICGAGQADGALLEVDHKVPVSKGGSDDISNLWTLCVACKRGKADNDL
jgi:predicted restriction endonuclease